MKYYKVCLGYSEFISIDENELEKSIKAQTLGIIVILKGGTANGRSITHIIPDHHRMLGYNYGYKLESEDFKKIKGKESEYEKSFDDIRTVLLNEKNNNQLL